MSASIVKAPADLSQYAGALPYDAEEFGIYKPLLNWYGYQAKILIASTIARAAAAVVKQMAADLSVSNPNADAEGVPDPTQTIHLEITSALQSPVASQIANATSQFIQQTGKLPTTADWDSLLSSENLQKYVRQAQSKSTTAQTDIWPATRGSQVAPAADSATTAADALSAAEFFRWAVIHQPDILNSLFLATAPSWRTALNFVSPLAIASSVQAARGVPAGRIPSGILSPVGLINLYREYFFELDTFLGPPVGHVWVSPGGSLELYEVSTRSQTITQTIEQSTTQTAKDETDTTDQDEISDAVKSDNKNDTKMGASVNAGGSFFGVVHADASASFSSDNSVSTSNEQAHKHSHTQSEKLSKEITQNYKTTFQTVTSTTDTTSRRYVLSNNTNSLANYELRRKLNLIGVQVQHIGTRLSWQTYVPNSTYDSPASLLGVGEFVPAPVDNSTAASLQPPDPLTPLAPKQTEMTAYFPFFPVNGEASIASNGDDYWVSAPPPEMHNDDNTRHIWGSANFTATAPDTGYTLSGITLKQASNAAGADVRCVPEFQLTPGSETFTVQLQFANFGGHNAISLDLLLTWDPPQNDPRQPGYQQAYQAYETTLAAAQLQDYVNATRTLIKVASSIQPRPSADLRDEERDAIYRVLYAQLTQIGFPDQHVTAEYIRELFDVDHMLYYVEPDYYLPRSIGPVPGFNDNWPGGLPDPLAGSTVLGWPRRPLTDGYLITEDSQPAPKGSSLGWTIQLDGDERRNEFLNAAWIKAVIPINPGHELDALAWLQNENVEGPDGLNDPYTPQPNDPPAYQGTVGEVLNMMAASLEAQNSDITNTLGTEKVFEAGFDPLANGIQVDPTIDFKQNAGPYQMFDFWLEVLPTDQVVAVDYDPTQHGA